VQYHPEYHFAEIAAALRRYGPRLVKDGLFADEAEIEAAARELERFDHGGTPGERWRAGLDTDVIDPRERLRELDNWLAYLAA
jgi:GMP synthase (glutamine-hydrolysing)